nr:hypothetical protein [Tolypothrix sp. NIES-4075]
MRQGRATVLTELVGIRVFKFTLGANQHYGSSLIPVPGVLLTTTICALPQLAAYSRPTKYCGVNSEF